MKEKKGLGWAAVWLIQLAALAAAYALLVWVSVAAAAAMEAYWLYVVCLWALLPALGIWASYWATLRGLLNYAAWVGPPLAMWLVHYEIVGYSPEAGAVIVAALAALIGASAGEVRRQRRGAAEGSKRHG